MTTDALEAESAVCGSILLDAACMDEVTGVLSEGDFQLEANRAIFRAAVELERRQEPVDPVTILEESRGAVSRDYMMDLMQATATAANAGVYAAAVRRASMRRALRGLGNTLLGLADGDDPRSAIADAQRALEGIEEQDTGRELSSSGDALAAFYRHRAEVDERGGGYVPTGFRPLDRLLGGGLLNGGFYILAARPGMGKTTFGLAVADSVAEQGPVLFVSLEMSGEQIAGKRIARSAGIGYDALMMGSLTDEERSRMAEHSARLARLPLSINRRPDASVDDIAHLARKVRGLRLLVVDYFGLIRPDRDSRNAKRFEAMSCISGQLKGLARRLDIPVLCLAQLNRNLAERKEKRPQLSDLRETGSLEQDADGVIFLHCPSYFSVPENRPGPWEPDYMQIIVAKNRHAGIGACDAAFYRAIGKIIPSR